MLLNLFKRFNANSIYNFMPRLLLFALFFLNSSLPSILYSQLGKQCILFIHTKCRLACRESLPNPQNQSEICLNRYTLWVILIQSQYISCIDLFFFWISRSLYHFSYPYNPPLFIIVSKITYIILWISPVVFNFYP